MRNLIRKIFKFDEEYKKIYEDKIKESNAAVNSMVEKADEASADDKKTGQLKTLKKVTDTLNMIYFVSKESEDDSDKIKMWKESVRDIYNYSIKNLDLVDITPTLGDTFDEKNTKIINYVTTDKFESGKVANIKKVGFEFNGEKISIPEIEVEK